MAEKRGPKKANLTVVQSDSPTGDARTATQKRKDNIVKAQRARAEQRAARKAAGEPSHIERYRAGTYPVSDWTDEEVSRGRPTGLDGFGGKFPTMTGRQHAEVKRELLRRGQRKFDSMYEDAIKVLHDVARHGEKDADRVKAALAIKEMVAGKVPDRIEIKSSDPWQDILDEIMTDDVLRPVAEQAAAQGD